MLAWHAISELTAANLGRSFRRWVFQLGGLGFIPLGLLDSSVVPLPGSMDALVIVLCARKEELWLYYAAMATVGSVLGAWVTYRLARRGGKEALERRLSSARIKEIEERFSHAGIGAIILPALLPPPAPLVPFLLAAGAMQFPPRKFVLEFTAGRIVRYTVLAFLAARYGRKILRFISETGHPVRLIVVGFAAAALVVVLIFLSMKLQSRSSRFGIGS